VGLYDPTNHRFHLRNGNTNRPAAADVSFTFHAGSSACVPLAGDWDRNGIDTVGLYDRNTGRFYLRHENTTTPSVPDTELRFGPASRGLVPLAGDWDGDGADSIGLYDQVAAEFYLRSDLNSLESAAGFRYGPTGRRLLAVVGDWDGKR